jgi:acyl-coenzyme A thioesterase PaaI-like protein
MIKQPNSVNCFVCGLENPVGLRLAFYEAGPGEVVAHYTPPVQFEGFPGVLHGGIIAAILDEAGGRVVMVGDHNRLMMTAKMEVRYRAPTPIGAPLTITGTLRKDRGRIALAHAAITLPDGSVTAEADLTLADLPDGYRLGGNLEALGWRVYPDAAAEA